MKKGILYGVGVGPGDPELLTLKAVRVLKQADVIAAPSTGDGRQTALSIAEAYVADKPLIDCRMPMLRDRRRLEKNYDRVADELSVLLDEGKTVAFITLGDPSIYSTFTYIHRRMRSRGYDARFVPGVTSFCAAAAALDTPLCEGGEMLHIVPSSHDTAETGIGLSGTRVLMKAGRAVQDVCETLKSRGELEKAGMVECCGMENEKIYRSMADFDGEAGYLSIIVVKEHGL